MLQKLYLILGMSLISSLSYGNMALCDGELRDIQADKDHDGILFVERAGNTGNGWCNFSDDGVLDKPIIIAEGFDFGVASGLDGNTTGLDIWNSLNQNGQLEQLRGEGYDVIVLDYHQPLEAIQANALLFKKVIETVNELKVGIHKNIVMGVSMGGLVSKSALAFMEYDGINHDTSLYASLDSPHGCAQINNDLQNVIQFLAGQDDPSGKRMWENVLRSEAALQMLCTTVIDWNDDIKLDLMGYGFKKKIRGAYTKHLLKYSTSGDGFPSKTRNVAFANGGGENQRAAPGSKLVEFDVGTELLDIEAYDLPYPRDTMPGSTAPWFDMLTQFAPDDVTINVNHDTVTYIPTMSAIGLGPNARYDYEEGRSPEYWARFETALLRTGSVSEEERAAAIEGLSDEEVLLYYQTESLMHFYIFDRERPKTYLAEAVSAGAIESITQCYSNTNEDGVVEETCHELANLEVDLTLVDNLATYTPFDDVYLNFQNGAHADVPLEHADALLSEIKANTTISYEKIMPAISLMALN